MKHLYDLWLGKYVLIYSLPVCEHKLVSQSVLSILDNENTLQASQLTLCLQLLE